MMPSSASNAGAGVVLALLASLPGCSRCQDGPTSPTATPVASHPAPPAPATDRHPADAVERALGVRLPERRSSELVPGLATLPYRRITAFDPARQLVLRVSSHGVRVLERALPADRASEDPEVMELLRWAMGQWTLRSGVGATRLMLAADSAVPPERVVALRRLALAAGSWRVFLLVRDGEALVEASLNPPPERRPSPR